VRRWPIAGVLIAAPACGAVVSLSPKSPPVLSARDLAPGFTLPTHKPGESLNLATSLAANDVVIVFYRGHW